ncbi:hypothetical protein LQ564_12330 [Massilia sp. G4R7]|uniref:Uncharacterized protein n=1 Tax=Massilia phyllostachyos TaxID=2898585 RepID=A0ABS8Q5R4_9BURK|nr:hypothetical protein [Massilia phyllostachyos]MCD2517093.1 hypothetical protein [Massilia phyllostachyos]
MHVHRLLPLLLALFSASLPAAQPTLATHAAVMARASAPVDFVLDKFRTHELLIFDDAMHTAVEPWRFYIELVQHPAFHGQVRNIFIEVLPVNFQPAIDAYLDSPVDDPTLLYPALQSAGDLGWAYQTYIDLLRAVREVNRTLPVDKRLRVIGTDQPSYWPLMQTRRDWELSMVSGEARDYHMYAVTASQLGWFKEKEKGILLTNTRHSYKGVRNAQGRLYWNAGTFFQQNHPGKSYAVRFHHAALELKPRTVPAGASTREGLERASVRWIRMEDGAWDCAHQAAGYRPLAFDLQGTPFGKAAYVGNHMMDAQAGQTMADAYDALVFLAPLDGSRSTARADIYTPAFRKELVRRLRVMRSEEEITALLGSAGVPTLEAYVDKSFQPRGEQVEPVVTKLPPLACKQD